MAFEGSQLKPVKSYKPCLVPSHKRSKSDSEKGGKGDIFDSSPKSIHLKLGTNKARVSRAIKKEMLDSEVKKSLKQEILQLENRLKEQFMTRCALETALGHSSSSMFSSSDSSMPKPAKKLIKEIAVLELEVIHLEQHLLSLYRKAFEQHNYNLSPPASAATGDKIKKPPCSRSELVQEARKLEFSPKSGASAVHVGMKKLQSRGTTTGASEACEIKCQEKLADHGVHRSHSSLSHRATSSARICPSEESLARALRSCHSQPLTFLEEEQDANPGIISLAEYLGANIADLVPESPNKLSEDMVRSMSSIYCKLAEPPLVDHGTSSSPASSSSSVSALSPQYVGDMWSPCYKRESTLDSRLINPFRVEGLKEFSGPYNAMVEIPMICREPRKLRDVEGMLQKYKSILRSLEAVDPRKLKDEERLAFWINVHDALMMHAHIEYGVPQNNAKRSSLLIKAACNIGGRRVNAAVIQGSILQCRADGHGKWFRSLISPRTKHKAGDLWQAYAVEFPEPLVYFALCTGSHSDPAVRIYNPKRLYQQLEAAKEEFIRATVGIWKEQKILLPKVICLYAKDAKLSSQELLGMVQQYLPESLRMAMQRCQQGRSSKIIDWVPHNYNFRYLLSRELASHYLS